MLEFAIYRVATTMEKDDNKTKNKGQKSAVYSRLRAFFC